MSVSPANHAKSVLTHLKRASEELGEVLGLLARYDLVNLHSPVAQLGGKVGKCFIVEECFVQIRLQSLVVLIISHGQIGDWTE